MKYLLPLLALCLVGCQDKVLGLLDNATPLVNIHVKITGDLQALRPPDTLAETPHLRVAVVWGATYLPDAFCAIYQTLPLDPSATAVAQAGCRDDFGFAPSLVGESVAVSADGTATIPLINLPNAAVLIGEVTSRIGYASLIVFDDRNESGTLELHRAPGTAVGGPGGPGGGTGPAAGAPGDVTPVTKGDFVYGASFISMTRPDQRIAYLEGTFDANNTLYGLFYPRAGCDGPPTGFSVLSAGGFSAVDGLKAMATGSPPAEDPATCGIGTLDSTVTIALQATETVRDVVCPGGGTTGTVRYVAPVAQPDWQQPWACMPVVYSTCLVGIALPGQDCSTSNAKARPSLAIAAPPGDCKATTHYLLKGCTTDPNCATPQWDYTTPAKLPVWWPCDTGATP